MTEIELLSQLEQISAFALIVYILHVIIKRQDERIERLINVIVNRENCEEEDVSSMT